MGQRYDMPWTAITTDKTTEDGDFNATTDWVATQSIRLARMLFEVQNTSDASGVVSPGVQTANALDTITTTAIFPSGGAAPTRNDKTGDGVSYPNGMTDLQALIGDALYVRFGVFFKGGSAGLKAARVRGVVETSSF